MELSQMQRNLLDYTKSLFVEGILDSHFLQLQEIQDESNPDFLAEIATIFFQDSDRILNDLTLALDQPVVDFKRVDANVHQFKGSSSSIGAQRVKNVCVVLRNYCEEQNLEGCHRCLQQLKQEYCLLKNRLESLLKMEQQIISSGGSIPTMEMGF